MGDTVSLILFEYIQLEGSTTPVYKQRKRGVCKPDRPKNTEAQTPAVDTYNAERENPENMLTPRNRNPGVGCSETRAKRTTIAC